MIDINAARERLTEFVCDEAPEELPELQADTELIESAILDSFALEELFALLSEMRGADVEKLERVRSNVQTIDAMLNFLLRTAS